MTYPLTSPSSGENFDARRCGIGPEDATEAEAMGGLGRGVLMGGIGENGFG